MSRISAIELELPHSLILSAEIEHERQMATYELLDHNYFAVKGMEQGPYEVKLTLIESRFEFVVKSIPLNDERVITLPIQALKSLMKDYQLICESFYEAIKLGNHTKVEAIDMGRRGLHDEASEKLRELMSDKAEVDFETARRLFTLIHVAHMKSITRV